MFDTALNDGEIITEVRFPKPDKAVRQVPQPGEPLRDRRRDGRADRGGVRVLHGRGPCVFRLPDFEQALASNFSPSAMV